MCLRTAADLMQNQSASYGASSLNLADLIKSTQSGTLILPVLDTDKRFNQITTEMTEFNKQANIREENKTITAKYKVRHFKLHMRGQMKATAVDQEIPIPYNTKLFQHMKNYTHFFKNAAKALTNACWSTSLRVMEGI